MSKNTGKVIYPLLAAVICAAAVGAYCLFGAEPAKNGAALIVFTDISESTGPVDTEISRSVSAVRRALKSRDFIKALSSASGLGEEELRAAVSVERLEGSKGAQIIVSGLEAPSVAPIVLINILHILENDGNIPEFTVLSACDIINEPRLPMWVLMTSGGLTGGLICFFLVKLAGRPRKLYYRPEKADENSEEYYMAVSMQEYIDSAVRSSLELGVLPLSAPEGLDKSGYTDAAEQLYASCMGASPAVIAVAPDFHYTGKGIPPQAKIAAYLACAFAEKGRRTVLIECCLKRPVLIKLFKSADKGGISDIAAGTATIWDALAINARGGVDVIAEKKSYPAPMAVFASQAFNQLMSYLSGQYDVMLLYAPKAWDCEEWSLIEQRCTGAVIVVEEKSMLTSNSARGMLSKECEFYAVCYSQSDS